MASLPTVSARKSWPCAVSCSGHPSCRVHPLSRDAPPLETALLYPPVLGLSQLPDRSLGGRRDALPPPRDLGLVCPQPALRHVLEDVGRWFHGPKSRSCCAVTWETCVCDGLCSLSTRSVRHGCPGLRVVSGCAVRVDSTHQPRLPHSCCGQRPSAPINPHNPAT
jgi:hypothetical protein